MIEKSLNFSFSSASYWITSLSGFYDVHSSKDIKLISLEEMYKLSN
ncbi:hypothetical protein [Helcococcus kunzii]|nr:hypothetical protein [Helcococcus kunzii]QUY65570.1 hypothetical protein GUI37_08540 [Helcococcus kunzii]